MASEVRITVGADTKTADKALKSFRERLDGVAAKARKVGIGLSAMGAGGVVAIKGFTSAALEQERAVKVLASVVDSAGESFADVEAKVMATTAALQKKTNFGDEAQIRVLAKLVPMLGSTDAALAALPAVMEVATVTGKDFNSVVDTMGPVLAGMTNRIRGTSLEFDASQGPMERVAHILKTLGGAAEADIDPFIQMSNAMGDVKESIGAQLLPLITPLITGLQSFAEWLQTLNPNVVKMAAGVLAAATAIGVIGGPILLLIGFLPMLSAGFATLSVAMGPITLVILGIAGVVAAGILIWKNWNTILDAVKNTFQTVSDFVLGAFRSHWGWLLPHGVLIKGLLFLWDNWDAIWKKIASAFETAIGAVGSAVDTFLGIFRAVGEAYQTNWSWILPGGALINAFKILKNLLLDDLIGAFEAFNSKVQEVVDAVKSKWQEFENRLGDFAFILSEKIQLPMEVARDIIIDAWNSIRDGIGSAIDKIKGFIQGFIDKLKDLIGWWKDSPFGKIFSALGGGATKLFQSIADFMSRETGFAHGGFIPGPEGAPRLAMVHGGELVLNRSQQAAAGSTFNITVNGNVDDPQDMARRIAEEVDAVIGRNALRDEQVRSR